MITAIIHFFKDLFRISYQDARGFFKLLGICFLGLGIFFGAKQFINADASPTEPEVRQLDSLARILDHAIVSNAHHELFDFDPNTLTSDSLLLLGIPEKLAGRLINYRESGAVFTVKTDLRKIYGFPEDLYITLAPHINLPDTVAPSALADPAIVDINTTDGSTLQKVTGIDPALAQRIIRYRNLLGGFIDKSQLAEVYEISSESLNQIESRIYIRKGFTPSKVRLNKADENTLKTHPYISDQLAADILRYREVVGPVESSQVLATFKSVHTTDFEKLISYLDFAN